MRAAFFGGTFDPIHRGHLAIAAAAADAFLLDQVIFAPTGRQPLKWKAAEAPFKDRMAMAALMCVHGRDAADPRFVASEIDAPRQNMEPNYTVETLQELRRSLPGDELFAIAGADSFLTLRSWRSPDELLRLAEWIVVSRPGVGLTEEQIASVASNREQRARVHLLNDVQEDVSATELRRRLHAGEDCTGLVPEAVLDYIQAHGLYR